MNDAKEIWTEAIWPATTSNSLPLVAFEWLHLTQYGLYPGNRCANGALDPVAQDRCIMPAPLPYRWIG